MKLENLEKLHRSMRSAGVRVQIFRAKSGGVEFECMFGVASNPYQLVLLTLGDAPVRIPFDVKKGYWITTYIKNKRLAKLFFEAIRTKDGKSCKGFNFSEFFHNINSCIPREAIRSIDTQRYKPFAEKKDENHKIYFKSWKRNDINNNKATEWNLCKTATLISAEAYLDAEKYNLSSCWSDKPTGADWKKSLALIISIND